jgi:isocitrate dehydrogenase kinase/phosphatase
LPRDEQFIEAPGIRGMVMLVFTLPGFDRVFKVIKDRFAPQKEMTAAHVRACYQLVKSTTASGGWRIPRSLKISCWINGRSRRRCWRCCRKPGKITDLGDRIVISHLYIERRMVPLNIWLEQVNGQALRDAVEEYGNAIRQLAAANIFPGDMLFKNFGVTRHGRVVFYDYDEICYMTEVNFRDIPPPRYPEDELASEPWYSVSPGDVFPEEFRHWLCADPRIGPLFEEMHADLCAPLLADCKRGLKTGMWKMSTPTAASSGLRAIRLCAVLTNPAVRQRHLFRRLNHQRAQLGHPVIGHA